MLNVDESKARMSAVVQKMIYADFSGVIYTAITENFNYLSIDGGERNQKTVTKSNSKMKIEVVKGHGEDLVSGRKTPMLFIADKENLDF